MTFKQCKIYLAASIAALLMPLAAATGQQDGPPPAQVKVVSAEDRQLAPEMSVSGTVISLNDSRISAEVEGPLLSSAQVGSAVNKGDTLARIDDRLLKIAARRAEARLASLKADMVFREADVKRFEELAEQNNASTARLQEVIARRETLKQDIADAKAVLDRARGDLERTIIRAPFAGHVAERLAAAGEYMSVGTEVIRLVDTANIEITMAAPISTIPFLADGNLISVTSGTTQMQLPIRTIVPVGNSVSRMVEVRLSANAKNWVIGAPVKITLPKGEAVQSVAVPRDALILKGGLAYIFVVGSDGKAERHNIGRAVTVGLWVKAPVGIRAGDKVIVRGGERLQPGQNVIIQNK